MANYSKVIISTPIGEDTIKPETLAYIKSIVHTECDELRVSDNNDYVLDLRQYRERGNDIAKIATFQDFLTMSISDSGTEYQDWEIYVSRNGVWYQVCEYSEKNFALMSIYSAAKQIIRLIPSNIVENVEKNEKRQAEANAKNSEARLNELFNSIETANN